jgi:proteic killer suppression protein
MIESFGNDLAEDLFFDKRSKATRSFPAQLRRVARRKLLYLHDAADLRDLRIPPANRLEQFKGDWKDFYSMRINDQWRLVFQWTGGNAYDAKIIDYH